MRRATRRALGGLALLLLVTASAARLPARTDAAKVALTPVKYSDLGKVVRGLKGKVVVVEFWAFY